MKFKRENGGIVSFRAAAIKTLLEHRQLNLSDNEAGGMLFGRLIIDCEDIIIDEGSAPLPSDKRSRFSFFRAKGGSQKIIVEKWIQSEGSINYLGEWHTHPEDDPTPSQSVDIVNWYKITNRAVYEQESLFFVIVGRRKTRVWELNKTTGMMTELSELI